MPPKKLAFPWKHRMGEESKLENSGQPKEESKLNEEIITVDPQGASSDGGSFRYISPFLPNVGGVSSIRSFTGASTPLEMKTPKKEFADGPQTMTKREQLESEKKTAPDKDLTLFAMRLAVLQKIARNCGALAFIWATVVILRGYAITLREIDFWFVTVILVAEGARIFSRSHELEWQHQDAGRISVISEAYNTSSDALFRSTRHVRNALSNMVSPRGERLATSKTLDPLVQSSELHVAPEKTQKLRSSFMRTWSSSQVPLFPVMHWIFKPRNVSRILYWMQLASAVLSIVLASFRLSKNQHFPRATEVDNNRNHTAGALIIFYSLAAFEALIFLLERAYWGYQTSLKRILHNVNEACGLSEGDLETTRRFFYDVYSKCLTESIFEGLKMDMVDYALSWLPSDRASEQLGGLRVLLTFCTNSETCDTLRTIGIRQGAVERVLEMITWKNSEELEIRKTAADLLCKLVKYNCNSIVRVAAISGSIEAVASLLSHDHLESGEVTLHSPEYIREGGSELVAEKNVAAHIVGLRILKHIAKDPLNCSKIGTTLGLLTRLISFIDTTREMLQNAQEPKHHISLVKNSLELLSLLAGTTGVAGKMLREDIAKVVYTVSNLRNILEFGESHMLLQELATKTLCSLAMDDEVREAIGRTGGIMRTLWAMFFKERVVGDSRQLKLAVKAGEVLTLLALRNEKNCSRMLRLKVREGRKEVVEELIDLVGDWEVGNLAMRLLRSFCAYTKCTEGESCKARIGASTPQIVKLATEYTGRVQEAAIGLAAQAVVHADDETMQRLLTQTMFVELLAAQLAKVMERHPCPSTTLPRVRRFCLELAMALAERGGAAFVAACHAQNFQYHVLRIADSASELENYATFSGAVGVTLHSLPMTELVAAAIAKLELQPDALTFSL